MPAEPGSADRQINRRTFEMVIRRAAELYAAEADAEDRLSEDEILRIGAEIGLPPALVRRALYELPALSAAPSAADRIFGPRLVSAARAVTGDEGEVFARLEQYLTTGEYLQLRRRRGDEAWFEPAEDPISRIARALSRPARSWHLARARRVVVHVRPLGDGRSHVRIDLDLGARRAEAVRGGVIGGALLGLLLAGAAGAAAWFTAAGAAGATAGTAAGLLAGLTGLGAGASAGAALSAKAFRRHLAAARTEVESLLDRLERGERLEPPPAPWRRRVERGLLGGIRSR